MPAGVSNGSSIQGDKRTRMILALAQGMSQAEVSRRFHVARDTVRAFEAREFAPISQRKERLAAQSEAIATRAADLLLERLHDPKESRKLPVNALIPAYGVAVDKTLALRGEAVPHLHLHADLTGDDLIAFAVARSEKKANARTLPKTKEASPHHAPRAPLALPAQDDLITGGRKRRQKTSAKRHSGTRSDQPASE